MATFNENFHCQIQLVRVTHKAGVTIKSTLKLYTDGLSILTTVHKLESPCAGKTREAHIVNNIVFLYCAVWVNAIGNSCKSCCYQ